jgi:hypothetical protein
MQLTYKSNTRDNTSMRSLPRSRQHNACAIGNQNWPCHVQLDENQCDGTNTVYARRSVAERPYGLRECALRDQQKHICRGKVGMTFYEKRGETGGHEGRCRYERISLSLNQGTNEEIERNGLRAPRQPTMSQHDNGLTQLQAQEPNPAPERRGVRRPSNLIQSEK